MHLLVSMLQLALALLLHIGSNRARLQWIPHITRWCLLHFIQLWFIALMRRLKLRFLNLLLLLQLTHVFLATWFPLDTELIIPWWIIMLFSVDPTRLGIDDTVISTMWRQNWLGLYIIITMACVEVSVVDDELLLHVLVLSEHILAKLELSSACWISHLFLLLKRLEWCDRERV